MPAAAKRRPDAKLLIRNPCACQGTAAHVHLACLRQWVRSSGKRYCSVCRERLPGWVMSEPPYVEFRVVRPPRRTAWRGPRTPRIHPPLLGAAQRC